MKAGELRRTRQRTLTNYQALPQTTDVLVFTAENQIHQPFEVVGIISHNDAGKFHILTLADAIERKRVVVAAWLR